MKKDNKGTELAIKGCLIEDFKIGEQVAEKLIEDYGLRVIKVIIDKPYTLCHYKVELDVIEEIVKRNIANEDSNYKNMDFNAAVIVHVIEYLTGIEGHTYIYKSELESKIWGLGRIITDDSLNKALEYLIGQEEIDIDKDMEGNQCIYLSRLHKAEIEIAKLIGTLAKENNNTVYDFDKVNEFIGGYECEDIKLNKKQQDAVKMCLTNRISVLTGVAGGGKTTAIRAIVEGFKHLNEHNIQLVSFTGKAVERMSSITGIQGSTIHRLLGMGVNNNRDMLSSVKADVLIIDEAGMAGMELLKILLFKCIKDNKDIKVVIVGDEFQFPSIAPGSVLKELVACGVIPLVHLTNAVRQENDSIISNALKVLKGIGINGKKSGIWLKKNEFEFIEACTEDIEGEVIKKIDRLLSMGTSVYDIQVMSPYRKLANGVDDLNISIARKFNSIPKREIYKFGILDPVIASKNNLKKGVLNGQKGIIKSVKTSFNRIESCTVDFGSQEVIFKGNDVQELQLAYASTFHKMQGSESRTVIIVIDKKHERMVNRELLYVGITRGIDKVIIIGDKGVFNAGIKKVSKERNSLLAERLIGMSIAS